MTRTCAANVFAALLLVPLVATGQSSDENLERALEEDTLAKELYERGEYEAAARSFQRAYDLYQHPGILQNLVLSHGRADNCAGVGEVFDEHESELDTLPPEEKRKVVEVRLDCSVEETTAAIEDQDAVAARAALNRTEQLADGTRGTKIEALRARVEALEARDDTVEDVVVSEPEPRGNGRTILGWSLVGAGTAAIATVPIMKVAFYDDSVREYNDCVDGETGQPTEGCSIDFDELSDREKRLRAAYTARLPLYIGGGLLAAVGAYFVVTDFVNDSVTVGISPTGVSATLRF